MCRGGGAPFCFTDTKSSQNGFFFFHFRGEESAIRIHTILNNGVGIQVQSMCFLRFYCFLYFLRDESVLETNGNFIHCTDFRKNKILLFRKLKSRIIAGFCLYAIFVVVQQNPQVPYYTDNHLLSSYSNSTFT